MDPITDWTLRLGWILVAWLFALGGVVGSFLNVVVYRLPARKSIVHPGSHCPACGHPIRWYHNLPIVSWLVLGGRCHDCRTKISPRYPLVEFAAAMLFAALFLADARPRILALAALETAPTISGRDIIIRYAGELWLLCTLLCAALIEFDLARPPRRIFWTAIIVGLLGAALFPLPKTGSLATAPMATHWPPLERSLAIAAVGAIAGCGLGFLLEVALLRGIAPQRGERGKASACSAALALACVGTFLGWAAAIAVGLVAAGLLVATNQGAKRRSALARVGFSALALVVALAWILAARWLAVSIPLMPA